MQEPENNVWKMVEDEPVADIGEIDQVGSANQVPWLIFHGRREDLVSVVGAIVATAEGLKVYRGGDARDGGGCLEGGRRPCGRGL